MSRVFAAMTPGQLAAALEEARLDAAEARRRYEARRAEAVLLEAHLLQRLGDGEAVSAPSGRVVFKAEGPIGKASPREAALLELAERLPGDLRPHQSWSLPTVKAIRDAEAAGRLPDGVSADDLLEPAPVGSVIRWRTLGRGEA